MIPSVLQELKEGRFRQRKTKYYFPHCVRYSYLTESNQVINVTLAFNLGWLTLVNGKKVSWFFGWRIRRAIKKASKK